MVISLEVAADAMDGTDRLQSGGRGYKLINVHMHTHKQLVNFAH